MHKQDELDREIAIGLQVMQVPEPAIGFEARIIRAAMREKPVSQPSPAIYQAKKFDAWWGHFDAYKPQMAIAAALALFALLIFNPLESYVKSQSNATLAEDRYTVEGVDLLADIDMLQDDDDMFASF